VPLQPDPVRGEHVSVVVSSVGRRVIPRAAASPVHAFADRRSIRGRGGCELKVGFCAGGARPPGA
jgi:hypothetical protein